MLLILWLIAWAAAGTPRVATWNVWLIALILCLVATVNVEWRRL